MRSEWHTVALADGADEAKRGRATSRIALALGVPLSEARVFVDGFPRVWPKPEDAAALAELGLEVTPAPAPMAGSCATHPKLSAGARCTRCEAALCSVCAAMSGHDDLCPACGAKKGRSRSFFRVRVAVLLAVLAVVLLYAWNERRRLERRTTWVDPVEVAIVVVPQGPMAPELLESMIARGEALQRRLTDERRRYAANAGPPFRITTYAIHQPFSPPPNVPDDVDSISGLVGYTWDKHNWVSSVDDAVDLSPRGLDARIYLVARPVADNLPRTVEGVGEDGGTVGIVEIDLSDDTVDLALFVAAHELFHLLGAEDRYDATGAIRIPDGLAEPDLEPRYPQRYAELMARHRAVSPTDHTLPKRLDELWVGQVTANEIGWLGSAP